MSSVQRNAKIYGAVETESFITFEGFCKKIYNTEQQEVEVFVDDKKIDTILANQKISKIEDTYEVFDTEGFCFTYKLPEKYIGGKHTLEFKTIEGEQLLHSPVMTISCSNERFNEYFFIESYNEPINEEKIKNLCSPNSIGIISTINDLNDLKFIDYIKDLCKKNTTLKIKFISFNKKVIEKINYLFADDVKQITVISPISIYELANEIEIFLYNNVEYINLYYNLLKYSNEVICFDIRFRRKFIKDYDHAALSDEIFTNPTKYNLTIEELEKYSYSYTKVLFERAYHRTINENYLVDLNEDGVNFYLFERINLVLKNTAYKHFLIQKFYKKLIS